MTVRFGTLAGALVALAFGACGKKEAPPTPDAATVAPATTAAATTAAPAEDAAAAADDAAPAAADDAAPAATDDAASAATDDAAPAAADDAAPAAADDAAPAADDAAPAAATDDVAPAAADDAAAAAPMPEFAPVKAPEKAFHDMAEEAQKTYMKEVVVPAMRERFQWFDGEEFAKFNCATCHGKDAKEKKFEMPNPELTKLPTTEEGFKALAAKEPKAMEFMGKVVVPAMATLLGEEPYNPETHKGFGCFECHTKEE